MMQTGGSIFKRKCCDRTSEGRSKRTRKTTKGDGWRNDTGDSQRRIRGADAAPLIEDDGSTEFKPPRDESDSATEDRYEIDGQRCQSFTRGNLRRQYDQALVNDPALQQHYLISGNVTTAPPTPIWATEVGCPAPPLFGRLQGCFGVLFFGF
jgi:hypothetical protein